MNDEEEGTRRKEAVDESLDKLEVLSAVEL